jgi:hypothetical protein
VLEEASDTLEKAGEQLQASAKKVADKLEDDFSSKT